MSSLARDTWGKVMSSHSGIHYVLGPTAVDRLLGDPKRAGFFHSRYKFAAKMMARCRNILDVGCGDGMGTATFLSDTQAGRIVGLDFEERLIAHAVDHLLPAISQSRPHDVDRLKFVHRDFGDRGNAAASYDGLCCLDVIEHIDPLEADWFMAQCAFVLQPYGVAVIGTPSALAAEYASRHSIEGHINLYSPEVFRLALERNFSRVFLFSMNDEVVHTGFDKLAHYLLALAIK